MKNYYPLIDGLRGIAILFVLIEHFATIIGSKFSLGFYGVELFFVISGYLITSILINSKYGFYKSYKNFIGRRILRIFPIYYLTIFILYSLQHQETTNYLIYLVTYTYNYAWLYYNIPINSITHFWSLAVEEQFYIFWPFIILAFRKYNSILIFTVTIIITIGYIIFYSNIPLWHNKFDSISILTKMATLALGGLTALLKRSISNTKLYKSKYTEITLITLLPITLYFRFPYFELVAGILSSFFVLKASNNDFNSLLTKLLQNKLLFGFGIVSYGIYVYHLPIAHYFTPYIFDPLWNLIPFEEFGIFEKIRWHSWVIKLPLFSVLSFVIAKVSFNFIEKPILKLKDQFFS